MPKPRRADGSEVDDHHQPQPPPPTTEAPSRHPPDPQPLDDVDEFYARHYQREPTALGRFWRRIKRPLMVGGALTVLIIGISKMSGSKKSTASQTQRLRRFQEQQHRQADPPPPPPPEPYEPAIPGRGADTSRTLPTLGRGKRRATLRLNRDGEKTTVKLTKGGEILIHPPQGPDRRVQLYDHNTRHYWVDDVHIKRVDQPTAVGTDTFIMTLPERENGGTRMQQYGISSQEKPGWFGRKRQVWRITPLDDSGLEDLRD